MKVLLFTFWCLIPLALAAFHYGPGHEKLLLDDTADFLKSAKDHARTEDWPKAVEAYEKALSALPKERLSDSWPIRLELARARMESGGLPQAREELGALVREVDADPQADPKLRDGALAALASSRFYMTYLMKLEGLPDYEWEPEIDAARQEQKLLLQRATAAGDKAAAGLYADDLEASIRLERMDPAELYGQAIPKKCCGCKSGKCQGKKTSPKPSQKPKDARGASAGPPNDGEGS